MKMIRDKEPLSSVLLHSPFICQRLLQQLISFENIYPLVSPLDPRPKFPLQMCTKEGKE